MLRAGQTMIMGLALLAVTACLGQEQYPKALLHSPTNHPAQRIIVLSVDGLHALDLARWVADQPASTLASLSRRGVTYTNAHLPWDDPAVGMLALSTGGTPLSTGIMASTFYDRALSPAGSHCEIRGAAVDLLVLPTNVLTQPAKASSLLPRNPANACKPVTPHEMVNVGNIFELVHAHGGRTAWIGDLPALVDLYRGPSGLGLTEAVSFAARSDNPSAAAAADDRRLDVLLNWIQGKDSTGREHPGVPQLFGMNFTAFAAAQRAPNAGYTDMLATPSPALRARLRHIDESIGRIVERLRTEHIFDSTWIVVTATYTQSPMARRALRHVPVKELHEVLDKYPESTAVYSSSEGVVMIWLRDPKAADRVARDYAAKARTLGIDEIYTSGRLKLFLEPERSSPRSPDVLLLPQAGVIWSKDDNAIAARSGLRDDDTHVALLVSGAQLTGRTDPTPVPTSQTPAMILRALGMEKLDLPALHREHSPALPGIF